MTVYRRARGRQGGCGEGNDASTAVPTWVVRLLCKDDSGDGKDLRDGVSGGGSSGSSGGVIDSSSSRESIEASGSGATEKAHGDTVDVNVGGGSRGNVAGGEAPGGGVEGVRAETLSGVIGVSLDGNGWGDLLNAAGTNLWHYHAALYGVWAAVAASTVVLPLPSPLPPPPWIAAAATADTAANSGGSVPRAKLPAVVLLLGPSVWTVAGLPPDGLPFEATPAVMAALPGHTGVHLQGVADALRARLFVARTPSAETAASTAPKDPEGAAAGVATAAAAAAAATEPLRRLLVEASAGDGRLERVVVPWRDGLLWDLAWDGRLAADLRSPDVWGCVCRGSLVNAYRVALLAGAPASRSLQLLRGGEENNAPARPPVSRATPDTDPDGHEGAPTTTSTSAVANAAAAIATTAAHAGPEAPLPSGARHACLISRQDRSPSGGSSGKPARNLHPKLLLQLLQALRSPLFLAPSLGVVPPAGKATAAATTTASLSSSALSLPSPGNGVSPSPRNSSVAGQLRSILAECGVLVGAHGAGLVGALGLPPGGAVVELAVPARRYAYFANVAALVDGVSL
ncbi:hypothetical protein I4F81_004876 [Pyropia yezoensis]|uniref:Uncharacterized protein n=1 Tax=Pyropia yezoensis TaxID=2788 RepID=A0ACC3BXP4_PYRYE|nr:hypothetical protein I4F81_004876 [Neopyropia yezoensis]